MHKIEYMHQLYALVTGTTDAYNNYMLRLYSQPTHKVGMIDGPHSRIDLNSCPNSPSISSSSPSATIPNENSNLLSPIKVRSKDCILMTPVFSCTIVTGVQFGWALQLSLFTPYIQSCCLHVPLIHTKNIQQKEEEKQSGGNMSEGGTTLEYNPT
ncbi:hypothetical protein PTKIN_Ptkin13bG0022300 [Pterospermum kingtungense]